MLALGAIDMLNILRVTYAVAACVLLCLLLWRAGRYRDRTRSTAYLHISGALLLGAAALTAINNYGRSFQPVMPFNILGVIGGYLFIFKNPMERVIPWKEHRGDEPDWNRIIGHPDRGSPGSSDR